jgi:hypothetical protein
MTDRLVGTSQQLSSQCMQVLGSHAWRLPVNSNRLHTTSHIRYTNPPVRPVAHAFLRHYHSTELSAWMGACCEKEQHVREAPAKRSASPRPASQRPAVELLGVSPSEAISPPTVANNHTPLSPQLPVPSPRQSTKQQEDTFQPAVHVSKPGRASGTAPLPIQRGPAVTVTTFVREKPLNSRTQEAESPNAVSVQVDADATASVSSVRADMEGTDHVPTLSLGVSSPLPSSSGQSTPNGRKRLSERRGSGLFGSNSSFTPSPSPAPGGVRKVSRPSTPRGERAAFIPPSPRSARGEGAAAPPIPVSDPLGWSVAPNSQAAAAAFDSHNAQQSSGLPVSGPLSARQARRRTDAFIPETIQEKLKKSAEPAAGGGAPSNRRASGGPLLERSYASHKLNLQVPSRNEEWSAGGGSSFGARKHEGSRYELTDAQERELREKPYLWTVS